MFILSWEHKNHHSPSTCGGSFPSRPELVATYGIEAVQECINRGYNVAIATAESSKTAINNEKFLSEINSKVFNQSFFKSAGKYYVYMCGHIYLYNK